MKKLMTFCMALLLAAAGTDSIYTKAEADSEPVRILFTNGLNDHVESFRILDEENKVSEAGGYEYLAAAIEANRTEQTVVVNAGGFSVGSMYASLNTSKAPDLTLMKQMGFDVTGVGLQDFTYGIGRFGEMLTAAGEHPLLVLANAVSGSGSASAAFERGWESAGGSECSLIRAGDYSVGVFGLCETGEAYGENSALFITDPLTAAKNACDTLKREGADLIVCLYSTDDEDFEELCAAASIDVLIAAGDHTAAANTKKAGNTVVVTADPFGASLGVLDIDPVSGSVEKYENVKVSRAELSAEEKITEAVKAYRDEINKTVMLRYGLTMYPLFRTPYSLTSYSRMNSGKGYAEAADLITDSMIESYGSSERDEAKPVSIITEGMVTGTLLEGTVNPDDVFKMAYRGMGTDGIPGYNLVHVYMKGEDLLALCEMDLILHEDTSPDKFHFGRMYYEYSMSRPETNRVIDVYTEEADGYYIAATDDRYYPVITTAEVLNMIPVMEEACGGALKCNVYDESGKEVTDYDVMTLRNSEGVAVKLWSAISAYAAHFDRGSDGVDILPSAYRTARKQRTKSTSMNLLRMFKHTNQTSIEHYAKIITVPIGIIIGLYILVWLINLKKTKN